MIYQLPTGKVIHLTLEQYLEMTDEDVEFLISINFGDHVVSPFYASAITDKAPTNDEEEDIDYSIDFTPEDEEFLRQIRITIVSQEDIDILPDVPGIDE